MIGHVRRCFNLIGALWLLLVVGSASAAPSPITGSITIDAPRSAPVGTPVTITIRSERATDGAAAHLTMIGTYGPRTFTATVTDQIATVTLTADQTQRAGYVSLVATVGAARGSAAIELIAGGAVRPITPIIGTRTIVANRRTTSMALALPRDQFGNPVADGTTITFRVQRPDDQIERYTAHTDHLLAWQRLLSGTRAGVTRVDAGDYAARAELLETADWPVPWRISADQVELPADGHSQTMLRTDLIRDANGNAQPDGTLVTFVITGSDGQVQRIPTQTIDGVAEATLRAATVVGEAEVRAVIEHVQSALLRIRFVAVDQVP